MAFEIPGFRTGCFIAGGTYTAAANQFRAVRQSTAADMTALVAGDGAVAFGVLQNLPDVGEACDIIHTGISKAVAGGTITRGDRVMPDSAGDFVAVTAAYTDTSDTGTADDALIGGHAFGIALESAADGEIFSMLIQPMGAVPTTVT